MRRNESRDNDLVDTYQIISLASFMESYNTSAPASFPRASEKNLKEFQEPAPSLFKNKTSWSIDKHRKRFMDWIYSHEDNS